MDHTYYFQDYEQSFVDFLWVQTTISRFWPQESILPGSGTWALLRNVFRQIMMQWCLSKVFEFVSRICSIACFCLRHLTRSLTWVWKEQQRCLTAWRSNFQTRLSQLVESSGHCPVCITGFFLINSYDAYEGRGRGWGGGGGTACWPIATVFLSKAAVHGKIGFGICMAGCTIEETVIKSRLEAWLLSLLWKLLPVLQETIPHVT